MARYLMYIITLYTENKDHRKKWKNPVMSLVATTDRAYSHFNTHAATRRDKTIELDLPVKAVGQELYASITFKRAGGKRMKFTVSNSQRVVSSE
ncbi:MAG: hypothetical protein WCQ70_11270 [Lentimicrobiaceae bacterium]